MIGSVLCPMCKAKVQDLKEHLVKKHGFSSIEAEKFIKLIEVYRERGLKPILKKFSDYTFDDFLKFLEDVNILFSDTMNYDEVIDITGELMNHIAQRFPHRVLEILPSFVEENFLSWRGTIAFLTILKTGLEEALPILMRLSLIDEILSLDFEIFDYLGKFKGREFELFSKYSREVKLFDYGLFFEWLSKVDEAKAIEQFNQFLREIPEEEYDRVKGAILELAFFLIEVYNIWEAIRLAGNLLNTALSIVEYGDPNKAVDLDFYLHVWKFLHRIDFVKVMGLSEDDDYATNLLEERGLNLVLDFIEAFINHPFDVSKIERYAVEDLDEELEKLGYLGLKVESLLLIAKTSLKYCKLEVAGYSLEKAYDLAIKHGLYGQLEHILYYLAEYYIIKREPEQIKKILNELNKKKELIPPLISVIEKLKAISIILSGDDTPVEEQLKKIEKIRMEYLSDSLYHLLNGIVLERSGKIKEAKTHLSYFTTDDKMTSEYLFRIAYLNLLFKKMCFKTVYNIVKSDEKLLDYLLSHIIFNQKNYTINPLVKSVFMDYLKSVAKKTKEPTKMLFYMGVWELLNGNHREAINYLKVSMKNPNIDRSTVLINLFCAYMLSLIHI